LSNTTSTGRPMTISPSILVMPSRAPDLFPSDPAMGTTGRGKGPTPTSPRDARARTGTGVQFPAQTLAAELHLDSGIRGMEREIVSAGRVGGPGRTLVDEQAHMRHGCSSSALARIPSFNEHSLMPCAARSPRRALPTAPGLPGGRMRGRI
jgi:hypothetical protein